MKKDEAINLIIAAYIVKQKIHITKEDQVLETARIANKINKIVKEAERR